MGPGPITKHDRYQKYQGIRLKTKTQSFKKRFRKKVWDRKTPANSGKSLKYVSKFGLVRGATLSERTYEKKGDREAKSDHVLWS